MKKILDIKKLATEIVGDGKRPNKYFVTIGYGWYKPNREDEDMKQANDSLDSVSLFFDREEDANKCFDGIRINTAIKEVTGSTIGQVIIEDRLTGVVKEKFIQLTENGRFFINSF